MFIILLLPFLSKIVLKVNIYKHQKLSLFIISITFICFSIFEGMEFNTSDIPRNIYNFLLGLYYSLSLVLIKYLTFNYYVSPFACLLYIGLGTIILMILFYLIQCWIIKDFSIITDSFIITNKIVYAYIFIIIIIDTIYY